MKVPLVKGSARSSRCVVICNLRAARSASCVTGDDATLTSVAPKTRDPNPQICPICAGIRTQASALFVGVRLKRPKSGCGWWSRVGRVPPDTSADDAALRRISAPNQVQRHIFGLKTHKLTGQPGPCTAVSLETAWLVAWLSDWPLTAAKLAASAIKAVLILLAIARSSVNPGKVRRWRAGAGFAKKR